MVSLMILLMLLETE